MTGATKIAALRELIGQIRPEKTPRKSFTPAQRAMVLGASDGLCEGCEEPLGQGWEVDHIRPLSMEGKHQPDNWQALCKSCHTGKTSYEAGPRAKSDRNWRADNEPRQEPSRFPSRPFPVATTKTKWPKQKFDKRRKVTA